MSLSDARRGWARILWARILWARILGRGTCVPALLACGLAAVSLAGCGDGGFRPLYGQAGIGANVGEKLAGIEIGPIPGRMGQRIRNELVFDTTGGGGRTAEPVYRLEIAIKETLTSTLVKTDGDALSQIYTADAAFNLIRLSDKTVVLRGVSFGRAGLERNPQIFSNVRAQDDAQNRAAKTIATELKTRLAAFLSTT
jgi:LPS-assembly lipoprotein